MQIEDLKQCKYGISQCSSVTYLVLMFFMHCCSIFFTEFFTSISCRFQCEPHDDLYFPMFLFRYSALLDIFGLFWNYMNHASLVCAFFLFF